jgi:hypothetical protein
MVILAKTLVIHEGEKRDQKPHLELVTLTSFSQRFSIELARDLPHF